MKICFKCGATKPLAEFYKHNRMADGHLNKCKECTRKDTTANREKKVNYYANYDKKRAMLPHRLAGRKQYLQTERGKEARRTAMQNYKENYPEKYRAQKITGNAVRGGKLKRPTNCNECGSKHHQIEAHHEDYNKPLDVAWLCLPCHTAKHRQGAAI